MLAPRATRLVGLAAAIALPAVLAYRFALIYRVRAGYPRRHPPAHSPASLGLAWHDVLVAGLDGGPSLPAWHIPAGQGSAPGVVLVHGWESARDRLLPHAAYLHAAGFHVLVFDVRGCGANPPEVLPVSVGEFGADARAAAAWLAARPDVSRVAVMGHSMGASGALVAAADNPSIAAVVALSTPAGPERLTRQTFRLANLPIPAPVAWPLAWLTARVYLRPRGHSVAAVSATHAVRRIGAPVLLAHGVDDGIVPVSDLARLANARRRARPDAVTETLVIPGGRHSWLYEFGAFRAGVARFLATWLGGPLDPDAAAEAARAVPAERLPEPERLSAVDEEPGGARSLLLLLRPSATRTPTP
jgi:alpha-beta hydrolase superfamily lysophospholipase